MLDFMSFPMFLSFISPSDFLLPTLRWVYFLKVIKMVTLLLLFFLSAKTCQAVNLSWILTAYFP